jgi:hypothetical protein
MVAFETTSHVGPDGKLNVLLPPELANTDVRIRVEPAGGVASRFATERPGRPMTDEEWRRLITETAGSMPNFPDVERPGPDAYDKRDPDW